MLIFGALLYATIFGNVTTIIQQIYAGELNFSVRLERRREYLTLSNQAKFSAIAEVSLYHLRG